MGDSATTVVAGGFKLPECATWHDGALWFVDMLGGSVNRLADGESESETVASFDRPTAVGFRPNGDMVVVDGDRSFVHVFRGRKLVDTLDLSSLSNHLNDMAIDHAGRAYIDGSKRKAALSSSEPAGEILLVNFDDEPRVVAENLYAPNGIGISPDGLSLVYGESTRLGSDGKPVGARLVGFTTSDDGSLWNEHTVATIARGGGDGLVFDSEGAIWVAVSWGHAVQRFLYGEVVEHVDVVDRKWALSCALGGPGMKTLFVCTGAAPPKGDPSKFTEGWIEIAEVSVPGFAFY